MEENLKVDGLAQEPTFQLKLVLGWLEIWRKQQADYRLETDFFESFSRVQFYVTESLCLPFSVQRSLTRVCVYTHIFNFSRVIWDFVL